MFQGIGVTAFESLSLAAVGDMFYLHERGWRTAVIVCSLACMASGVQIIGGVMFQRIGYLDMFIAELPFNVVGLLATIFLIPETQFLRRDRRTHASPPSTDEKGQAEVIETVSTAPTPRKPLLKQLAPWSGTTYTPQTIPTLLAKIFIHLLNPAVLWIMLVSAVLVALFVVSAYILSQLFSVPPYNLDVAGNGYFWVGAFVGGILAVGIGPVCDWSARTMARLNGGIFEAEFRIPVNVFGGLFCGLGWFMFMWVLEHPRPNGYLLGSFFHGCVCFGISVPSTSAGLYIL